MFRFEIKTTDGEWNYLFKSDRNDLIEKIEKAKELIRRQEFGAFKVIKNSAICKYCVSCSGVVWDIV